jgi:hypothetical protein
MAFEVATMTFGELAEDLATGALQREHLEAVELLGTNVAPVVRREVTAHESRAA